MSISSTHDDVIKWKHFPRYWPFVQGIHRWPVNSRHKGPVTWSFGISFHLAWINGCVNNCEAGDSGRQRTHYDVIVMIIHGYLTGIETCKETLICVTEPHSLNEAKWPIYASVNWVIIGSDNGLSLVIWISAGLLLPYEQNSMKFESKYENIHSRKCDWNGQ